MLHLNQYTLQSLKPIFLVFVMSFCIQMSWFLIRMYCRLSLSSAIIRFTNLKSKCKNVSALKKYCMQNTEALKISYSTNRIFSFIETVDHTIECENTGYRHISTHLVIISVPCAVFMLHTLPHSWKLWLAVWLALDNGHLMQVSCVLRAIKAGPGEPLSLSLPLHLTSTY